MTNVLFVGVIFTAETPAIDQAIPVFVRNEMGSATAARKTRQWIDGANAFGQRIRAPFDRDSDGNIDTGREEEFLEYLHAWRVVRSASAAKELSDRFDANKDGKLSKDELKSVWWVQVGSLKNEEVALHALAVADLDANGYPDYIESDVYSRICVFMSFHRGDITTEIAYVVKP